MPGYNSARRLPNGPPVTSSDRIRALASTARAKSVWAGYAATELGRVAARVDLGHPDEARAKLRSLVRSVEELLELPHVLERHRGQLVREAALYHDALLVLAEEVPHVAPEPVKSCEQPGADLLKSAAPGLFAARDVHRAYAAGACAEIWP